MGWRFVLLYRAVGADDRLGVEILSRQRVAVIRHGRGKGIDLNGFAKVIPVIHARRRDVSNHRLVSVRRIIDRFR